jgi:hypothetical protein
VIRPEREVAVTFRRDEHPAPVHLLDAEMAGGLALNGDRATLAVEPRGGILGTGAKREHSRGRGQRGGVEKAAAVHGATILPQPHRFVSPGSFFVPEFPGNFLGIVRLGLWKTRHALRKAAGDAQRAGQRWRWVPVRSPFKAGRR